MPLTIDAAHQPKTRGKKNPAAFRVTGGASLPPEVEPSPPKPSEKPANNQRRGGGIDATLLHRRIGHVLGVPAIAKHYGFRVTGEVGVCNDCRLGKASRSPSAALS